MATPNGNSPKKYLITDLPVAPLITLTADPSCLRSVTSESGNDEKEAFQPSSQRRARLVAGSVHYSHVRPLVVSFPYEIDFPEDDSIDKAMFIESWLSEREPTVEKGKIFEPKLGEATIGGRRILLGVSGEALPELDLGNAEAIVNGQLREEDMTVFDREFVSVVGGSAMLKSFEPYALRYSGHQFGQWAGQLGDGRAITVLRTSIPSSSPDEAPKTYELQLKGAGRTPYSRSADGLAVTRSSVREYLASEFVSSLGVSTTRALCMVGIPQVRVRRERLERASVVGRVAPSFLRIGSLQALNLGGDKAKDGGGIWGGGQQGRDLKALEALVDVAAGVLGVGEVDAKWKMMLWEIAERNARMVAGWQVWGFMHGVINTDNVSILGLTIDYGPYAFMDVFDHLHICNHSDDGGRYSYRSQPGMIWWAVEKAADAMGVGIGLEMDGKKDKDIASLSDEEISAAETRALTLRPTLEAHFYKVFKKEWLTLMGRRLGLSHIIGTEQENELEQLCKDLLDEMQDGGMDFYQTFRFLSSPPSSTAIEDSTQGGLSDSWNTRWRSLAGPNGPNLEGMNNTNPTFVLRQWVLEEVIKEVEADLEWEASRDTPTSSANVEGEARDPFQGRKLLAKVMQMSKNPSRDWPSVGEEEARLCQVGDEKMLGFQCSCSS